MSTSRISYRIDRPEHVCHRIVFEAAQNVDDGIHLPDVGQELVAETLAMTGSFDQAGDIGELNGRVRHILDPQPLHCQRLQGVGPAR